MLPMYIFGRNLPIFHVCPITPIPVPKMIVLIKNRGEHGRRLSWRVRRARREFGDGRAKLQAEDGIENN